jgi:vancomycin permeability regulator SanA
MNALKKVPVLFYAPLLFILLSLVGACSFTNRTSTTLFNKAKNKSYDLVIVPGVPLEDGKWSPVMKARIYWSKFLYDRGIAKNIMYSGNAVYTPYVEAEVMALYAEALGIPREHIFTESKAEHSTENIYYSYKKSKLLNFETIALASDPFQTKMLERFTRENVSADVDLIPIVFDSLRKILPLMTDPVIDPSTAYVHDFTPLPERKSFWTRLKGTMGRDMDKTAYEPVVLE